MTQVEKDVPDNKHLVKSLSDAEVELQKYQSSCRELESCVADLGADNCQLKTQLAALKDQLDHIQHELVEDRKVRGIQPLVFTN